MLEEVMETFHPEAAELDGYTIYVVPHSHIDVEWHWDYPETIRKVNAIFGSVLELLRRDPDYRFSQDQVLCIEPFLERLSGEDREDFIRFCRENRFEVVGGMYVQPEVAEPCGEALIRQILIGKRWFSEKLGLGNVPIAWNSDTFGQVSQLPQILTKSGFGYFVFYRGMDAVPGRLAGRKLLPDGLPPAEQWEGTPSDFVWRGPDGSRIQTHWMSTGYSGNRHIDDPARTARKLNEIAAHATTRSLLFPWGDDYYDPRDQDSEQVLSRVCAIEIAVPVEQIRISSALEYLESVKAQGGLPEIEDELTDCDLRGCYDNRTRLKQANRRCEQMLLAAEKLSALCRMHGLACVDGDTDSLWRALLMNHFHDVIAGSHCDQVYLDAMARYASVEHGADVMLRAGLQALGSAVEFQNSAHPVLVFNPCSFARGAMCQVEVVFAPDENVRAISVRDHEGASVPVERVEPVTGRGDGWRSALISFVARDVPGHGYATYQVVPCGWDTRTVADGLTCGQNWIESPAFRVEADPATGLLTITDKLQARVICREANELVADSETEPDLEGFNVRFSGESSASRDYPRDGVYTSLNGRSVSLRALGPFKDSRVAQTVTLYADMPIVEFVTRIEDFTGGDVMIKARFPTGDTGRILYETPFAVTERPEGHYCAQTFAALEGDKGGVAVINTGNAGYFIHDGTIDLALLRSVADYRGYHAHLANEHGTHEFRYALYSYAGNWQDSDVIQIAHGFNAPMPAREIVPETGSLPPRGSLLETSGDGMEWVAMKRAVSGNGVVLRGYEARGKHARARITLPASCSEAWIADMLEQPLQRITVDDGCLELDLNPWEITTVVLAP